MELRGNRNLLWNWWFIEMDLKETIWHGTGLDSSNLGQNRETCVLKMVIKTWFS